MLASYALIIYYHFFLSSSSSLLSTSLSLHLLPADKQIQLLSTTDEESDSLAPLLSDHCSIPSRPASSIASSSISLPKVIKNVIKIRPFGVSRPISRSSCSLNDDDLQKGHYKEKTLQREKFGFKHRGNHTWRKLLNFKTLSQNAFLLSCH